MTETRYERIADRALRLHNDVLGPLAKRYAFPLSELMVSRNPRPSVLFLGNHSSGKSSFINYLLGMEVQRVGVAPTDDGFTFLMHGEPRNETRGPAVLEHPQFSIAGLRTLGSAFAARLRLLRLPHPFLREVTLIDSPGMIDSADSSSQRGYDFMEAVRRIAEGADLVVFFFDPDKPGTTGETVAAFTQALTGLEYKLLLVFNKVDRFDNVPDFVRAYGALCWNLARVVHTKDIPNIFSMYLPLDGRAATRRGDAAFPLTDFDRTREQVIDEIRRVPERRADNLVGTLAEQISSLYIHVKVCSALRRIEASESFSWSLIFLGALFGIASTLNHLGRVPLEGYVIAFGLLAILLTAGALSIHRLRKRLIHGIDAVFEEACEKELAFGTRQDLRERWTSVKPHTVAILERRGLRRIPLRPLSWQKDFRDLNKVAKAGLSNLLTEGTNRGESTNADRSDR